MKTLKNKKIFLLAFLLLIPVFLLIGCDEPETYSITVYSSYEANGRVYGGGNYTDGQTVTLRASGKNRNRVICWLYQNKTILADDDTYTISTSEDGLSSKLTFTARSDTHDRYTAVFESASQKYFKLDSYKLTSTPTLDEPLEEEAESLMSGSLTIQIGENINSYREAFSYTGEFMDNLTTEAENVNQVLYFVRTNTNGEGNQIYYLRYTLTNENGGTITSNSVQLEYGHGQTYDPSNLNNESATIYLNSDNSYSIYIPFQLTTGEEENQTITNCFIVLNISQLSY